MSSFDKKHSILYASAGITAAAVLASLFLLKKNKNLEEQLDSHRS
jgi:LPXTG-motif cell wall-anchored protein